MLSVIVRSKLGPTAPPDFAVARPRLLRVLDEVWDHRLALIAAPAGYGKSVVLSQWHDSGRQRQAAWLVLDERDRDPVRMGTHFLECLAGVDPRLGQRGRGILGSPSAGLGDEVVDLVLDGYSALDTDVVVVLEDLDHLEGSPVIDDLSRLIMEAPRQVHYVIASRSDPTVPTHRLRAAGQLLEVRADDLRFSSNEAAELIRALSGHDLASDAVDRLLRRTEGWPVAVQLAALSLRDTDDAAAIARFDATNRGIVDYLSAELLDSIRPELRTFLLDVSVLHELDPVLCDRITGRRDAAELLAELRRRSLFVVPSGDGACRLHRLVRAFLSHDLLMADPDRPMRLRELAATWCLEQGDPGQAAEYLIAAHSWDRLIELIHQYTRAMWDRGHVDTALGWVRALPREIQRNDTWLRLTEAGLDILAGRPESGAELLASLERDGELTAGEQVIVDVMTCSLVEVANPDATTLTRAERSIAALDMLSASDVPDVLQANDPAGLQCDLRFTAAKIQLFLGGAGALDTAAAAVRTPPSSPAIFLVQAHGTLALCEALANRGSAVASARRAMDLATEHLADEHPALIPAELALAVAARNRDDLDEADAYGEAALARAVRWRRRPMVGLIIAERAFVDLARGAPDAALSRLSQHSALHADPLTPLVDGRFHAVERRARAALGQDEAAAFLDESPTSWELALTNVALAAEAGDAPSARKMLQAWPTSCAPFGEIEEELATALVERAEGAVGAARSRVAELLATSARDGLVGPFACAGGPAIAVVADVAREHPHRHVETVLAATRRAAGRSPELVDPLSGRELELLRLLPSRMSNAEIGRALSVSINTVKTHLKHIYQKLGVADRDSAIQRARELRFLKYEDA